MEEIVRRVFLACLFKEIMSKPLILLIFYGIIHTIRNVDLEWALRSPLFFIAKMQHYKLQLNIFKE